MQEEILIKRYRSGTTIHFFNTDINPNNYETSTVPAVVKLSSVGNVPMELYAFDGSFLTGNSPMDINSFDGVHLTGNQTTVLWKRNEQQNWNNSEVRMNYVQDTYFPDSDYVSGRTFSQIINLPIENVGVSAIGNRFIEKMNEKFTAGTTTFVFAEPILIDDLYANVKLERTYDVLNTLSIYNKVSGEYPIRESNTGVVFGKLEAIQKITDANGNKIRIPLRNVPIGIFTTSDDFQTQTDLDKDGNRIRLNYRPITETQDTYPLNYRSSYFNEESAEFDNTFLTTTPLSGLSIHPTFSNVVYTNENGEFFLHNIEIGPQILFFEVDLLKQGLTKDEVALNFFPYPPNYDNISIDTLPHYFYRAIPIDVVPSWGTSYQTGYTEVNISTNLDLRKWATYVIPPVSYRGYEMDSAYYFENVSRAPLTVKVRDMSKYNIDKLQSTDPDERLEVYPSKRIQMVEISNIVDRNSEQQWEWANEFSQIKDKALFFTYGHHAIKLPANIYDDEGYKTDKFGESQESKGVWLCGYQIKVFLTKENELYRTTGMALCEAPEQPTKWYDRDHFHCSLYGNDTIDVLRASDLNSGWAARAKGIDFSNPIFPYEQAWNKNYPTPYSIPKPPKNENFLNFYQHGLPPANRPYLESPQFSDGDMIYGYSWLNDGVYGWNGVGLSWYKVVEQYTDFATDVAGGVQNADMYRYEPIGAGRYGQNQYFGCYSNGYCNNLDTSGVGGHSEVLNAEEFQRVEAGYGYYLFPSSMPRLAPTPSVLFGYLPTEVDIFSYPGVDNQGYITNTNQTMSNWWSIYALSNHYNSYSVLTRSKSIAMDLCKKEADGALINDKLNIYRIIEASTRVPHDISQPTIPTYTIFDLGYFFMVKSSLNGGTWPINLRTWDAWQTNSNYDNNSQYMSVVKMTNIGNKDLIITNIYDDGANILTAQEIIPPGKNIKLYWANNASIESDVNCIKNILCNFQGTQITVKGNSEYNETDNKYTKSSIKFEIYADWVGGSSGFRINQNGQNSGVWMYQPILDNYSSDYFDATESGFKLNVYTHWNDAVIDYYEVDNNGYPRNYDNDSFGEITCTSSQNEVVIDMPYIWCNPGPIMDDSSWFVNCIGTGHDHYKGMLESAGSCVFYWTPRDQNAFLIPNALSNILPVKIGYVQTSSPFYGY